MRIKATWRTAFELCTDEAFTEWKQIRNLQELSLILGSQRGVNKNNLLRIFIQDLKRHVLNWYGAGK